uniref:Uncharacterized protein n=1 Tax=Erwinia amylovora ATCC BAA-2158 TaxID=889211 RepID=E5B0T4_ERWAM|nr:hypothetical protein predicted by Glimmer/Critica [Erwinia amylovora ATCC BAA-2158]
MVQVYREFCQNRSEYYPASFPTCPAKGSSKPTGSAGGDMRLNIDPVAWPSML